MPRAKWDTVNIQDQKGRLVIITGATSGIGEAAARVLAGKNATIIIAARNIQKGQGVISEISQLFSGADISVREMDLTSLASIETFSNSILNDFEQLDVLVNNAGIMMCPYSKTSDGFEIQMGTNHLGHFALTGRLLPLLKQTRGSRIVTVSSLAHKMGNIDLSDLNWEKRKYNTNRAYGDSKLANLYFTYELARRLEGDKSAPLVTAAHPGWTKTDLQRHSGFISFLNPFFSQGADMGALPTLRAGFDDKAEQGDYYGPSKFFEMHGPPVKVKSTQRSHDTDAARKLWKASEDMTGVKIG